MEINLKNIEQIIFMNKEMREALPEFNYLFEQWELGYRIPGLKSLSQKSVVDLLNALQTTHQEKISKILNEDVFINKLNNKLVDHYDCTVDNQQELCQFTGYKDFCLYREGDNLNFTFWR